MTYVFRKRHFVMTPPYVAERLVELAELQLGHCVLEPSAGKGALVAPIRHAIGVRGILDCYENDKGYFEHLRRFSWGDITGLKLADFLDMKPGDRRSSYDRVVMNPPWAGEDVLHVRHAARFLRPGGILVAAMSPEWTFRHEAPFASFAEWAARVGATWEPLKEYSFSRDGVNLPGGLFKMMAT